MNALSTKQMQKELEGAETLGAILNVLTKYYDVDDCYVGKILKVKLIPGIDKIVHSTRCKAKKQFQ